MWVPAEDIIVMSIALRVSDEGFGRLRICRGSGEGGLLEEYPELDSSEFVLSLVNYVRLLIYGQNRVRATRVAGIEISTRGPFNVSFDFIGRAYKIA